MGMFSVVRGNFIHMVFPDTPLHVDAVTDYSKLPWHKTVVQKQSSLRLSCLIISSSGQHKCCNTTYGRTR